MEPDDFILGGPIAGGGGGSGTQAGFLYCSSPTVGVVKIDVASKTYEITGVPMNGTAFGNGHDDWWYVNGGAGQAAARELYRMQPELVPGPQGPRVVIELMGSGARAIEDLASSPDGLTLYGVGEGFLFTLDRQTGQQTDVGALGVAATGIAFADTGEPFVSVGNAVYALDLATASTTLAFTTQGSGDDLAGIQLPPVVPALSLPLLGVVTALLCGIGLLANRRPRRL